MSSNSQPVSPDLSSETLAALSHLCLNVLPIWTSHLSTSRAHSEAAVSEMLMAFSAFGPYLQKTVKQSEEIAKAMAPADGVVGLNGLAEACADELMVLMQSLDEEGMSAVRRVTTLIKTAVAAMHKAADPLAQESSAVAEKLDRMYVGFQYQDRVDQMMALLENDMTRLNEILLNPSSQASALDAPAWLARLESLYAMAEQRTDHGKAGQSARPDADTETSFF